MDSREKSPELWYKDHETGWWSDWWTQDFSWEGLKNKRWRGYSVAPDGEIVLSATAPPGSREATLQDYWRDENQNLVEEKGPDGRVVRHWTRVHLPTVFEDRSPTAKSSWSDEDWLKVDSLLATRLERAAETLKPDQVDNRAQFQGLVVRNLPARDGATLNLSAEFARFLHDVDFSYYLFGPSLDLQSVFFAGSTSWKQTTFGGVVTFNSAQFCGTTLFAESKFNGSAWFLSTQFGAETSFISSNFKDAIFSNAHFFAATQFTNSRFCEANFDGARFWHRIGFDRAVLSGKGNFVKTTFGRKNTQKTESTFVQTQFCGPTLFNGAVFWSEAAFTAAHFEDTAHVAASSLIKLAQFEGTQLMYGAHFDNATFHSYANFENVTFVSDATFDRAGFKDRIDFDRSTFSGGVSFNSTNFHDSPRTSFQSVNFAQPSNFKNAKWPVDPGAHSGTFRDVEFLRLAEFSEYDTSDSSGPFSAFAMFDGARFKGEARFTRGAVPDDLGFKAAFNAACNDERHLRALENGCRALKLAAENFRDRLAEQTYYRYELTCRRKQKATELSERTFSCLYNWFSNYGISSTRPLSILFGVWIASAILYWVIALSLAKSPITGLTFRLFAPVHSSVFDSLRLSAHVIFAPFAVWNGNFCVSKFDEALLKADPAIALGVRFVATLESILAAVLIFLSILALRRRFKID